ncbi:MAG: hypothetical protein R3B06_27220 [Kofleriaceae bacterium]
MRLVNRSAVLFLGSVVTMGLVACGGDDGTTGDDTTIDPNGTNHTYVASKIQLPASNTEATALGLDIDNDGTNDNQLGSLLVSLRSLAPSLDLQGSLDTAVDQGEVILMSNVKATSLASASGVGMWVYVGDMPMPAACTDANDMVCRHHLDGMGMFSIKAGSQTDAKLAGIINAGTFTGGPGTVNLQLSLSAGSMPLDLPLQKAKAEVKVTETGFTSGSKLGGAISQTDIEGKIHPAIQAIVADLVDRDCPAPRDPNMNCSCMSGSTGASVLGFLDADHNCDVTVAEVTATLNGLLTDDIDLNGDGVNDAVSLGIGLQAVKGTFTVP